MKVLIGIPTYDGKLPVDVVKCLLDEKDVAHAMGHELRFLFLPSCSHPASGRNKIARHFLDSDCDKLFFLDADVTFEIGSITKVIHYPVDVVGGAYRFKSEPENYPVGWLSEKEELWANELGLLEVGSLPTGFLSITRKALDDFRAAYPERRYEHHGDDFYCYFQMPYENGSLWGEDAYFCKSFRDMGGQVWLDPELSLTHWDQNKAYIGHIGQWLKTRSGIDADNS